MISTARSPDMGNSQGDGWTEATTNPPACTCQRPPAWNVSEEQKWLLLLFHLLNLMGMSPIGGRETRTLLAWGSGKCSLLVSVSGVTERAKKAGIVLSTNSQHPAQKACGKDKETCQQKSAVRCGGDAICEFLLLSETYHAHTRAFWVDSVQHVQWNNAFFILKNLDN